MAERDRYPQSVREIPAWLAETHLLHVHQIAAGKGKRFTPMRNATSRVCFDADRCLYLPLKANLNRARQIIVSRPKL